MKTYKAKDKFTFKKEPPATGLYAVGHPYRSVHIKHNKLIVGQIMAPYWATKDQKWAVRFTVGSENGWYWSEISERFDDAEAARKYVNKHAEEIVAWGLYHREPDDDE